MDRERVMPMSMWLLAAAALVFLVRARPRGACPGR